MKIHEYQAKFLLKSFGVNIPNGEIASSLEEAKKIALNIGMPVVVKAQIHAGGRGKVGGIKISKSIKDIEKFFNKFFKKNIITAQTDTNGQKIQKILIEECHSILREIFLSFIIDQSSSNVLLLSNKFGGTEIEKNSNKSNLGSIKINPLIGIKEYHCRRLSNELEISKELYNNFSKILISMYKMFINLDCSILEINPLAITSSNKILALDAKVIFDSNALYRHLEILEMRDIEQEDFCEYEASKHNLNYISLDGNGNIGSMVNGAGLAMATMDIIKSSGANPSNFLDVGGGANVEMIENGLKILLNNKNIKGILINIFGGILRCDVLAKGVVKAAKNIKLKIPIVIRMEGTNLEKGKKILLDSEFNFITANDINDATKKISEIVKLKKNTKNIKSVR